MPKQRRRQKKVFKRARREYNLAARPERRQVKQDYRQGMAGLESAYGGFNEYMEQMPEFDTSGIASALSGQIQGLAGFLPGFGGMPTGEVGAAQNLMGTIGTTGFNELASQEARGDMYQQSALREGALARRSGMENLTQERQQALDALRSTPADIFSRVDQLREEALQRRMARSSMQSDEAWRRFLMDQAGLAMEEFGRDRPRRRRRNNNRGNPQGNKRMP